eukprot:1816726-Rhodomonas_salina.1
MPAVQMWAKICFKYEGVSDINSKNLLKDLNNQYQCKANKNLDMSAAQFNEELTDLLAVYGKTFKTVALLISWIKICCKE